MGSVMGAALLSLPKHKPVEAVGGVVQQISVPRCAKYLGTLLVAVVLATPLTGVALAQDAAEPGGTRKEILSSLHDVQRKYGTDAVMLEGHLLGHAIRSGSITDAVVSIPGLEERGGKRFLSFKVETGIIYNDRDPGATARPARVWREIIEATLRKFRTLSVPADGVVLTLTYAHKPYADEADLRAHLRDEPGQGEATTFFLLTSDVTELIANRISPQQLLDRTTVLLNGTPTHLVLDPQTPAH